MTQDCSLSTSTASASAAPRGKRLPKGIRIVGADLRSAPKLEAVPVGQQELPWGYIVLQHMAAGAFEQRLAQCPPADGGFKPRCFIHRTVIYRQKPSGHGVQKEERPSVSGLVFLQGTTRRLRAYLRDHFPRYHLVRNCATGRPASIPDAVMRPFMDVMRDDPRRITFLQAPFERFAADHVRLRVLTGPFAGQEGYVVRVRRDRRLVMDFGGYAVAISDVHNDDFAVAE